MSASCCLQLESVSPLDVVYRGDGVPVVYGVLFLVHSGLKLIVSQPRDPVTSTTSTTPRREACGERTTKYSPSFNTGAQGLHVRRLLDTSLVFLHRVLENIEPAPAL